MVKFLIIGDSHVPKRASNISKQIQIKLEELTKSELFDYTFFTGDEINYPEFMEFLNLITERDVFRVIGNMDYYYGTKDAPMYQELNVVIEEKNNLVIGLTHGHQVSPRGDHTQLELLALEKEYNIMISGHTHKEEIYLTKNGILLLNPGSITGAWSFVASGIPSFIVLYMHNKTKNIEISLFQLGKESGKVKETKLYYIFEKNKIIYKY